MEWNYYIDIQSTHILYLHCISEIWFYMKDWRLSQNHDEIHSVGLYTS